MKLFNNILGELLEANFRIEYLRTKLKPGTVKMILTRDKKFPMSKISDEIVKLFKTGEVVVGYRTSCGSTDETMKKYEAFYQVIRKLKKDKFKIKETPAKAFGNKYATSHSGFWDEFVFQLNS